MTHTGMNMRNVERIQRTTKFRTSDRADQTRSSKSKARATMRKQARATKMQRFA